MIPWLLRQIGSSAAPSGPTFITVSLAAAWPRARAVVLTAPSVEIAEAWPRVLDIRMDP